MNFFFFVDSNCAPSKGRAPKNLPQASKTRRTTRNLMMISSRSGLRAMRPSQRRLPVTLRRRTRGRCVRKMTRAIRQVRSRERRIRTGPSLRTVWSRYMMPSPSPRRKERPWPCPLPPPWSPRPSMRTGIIRSCLR